MNPLLVMALLSAGSVGANKLAESDVNKARKRALDTERTRRAAAEKRSAQSAQSTADLFVQSASDEKARAAELTQKTLDSQQAVPTAAQPINPDMQGVIAPSGSTATIENEVAERTKARAYANKLGEASDRLSAFGDVMVGNNILANRNAQAIDRENTGVRNWNQFVLPQQLEAANKKGRDWNTIGDVLQLVSSIYGMSALAAPGTAGATAGADAAANAAAVSSTTSGLTAATPALDILNTTGGLTAAAAPTAGSSWLWGAAPQTSYQFGKTRAFGGV